MTLKTDLDKWVSDAFKENWITRKSTSVPDEDTKLGLGNDAIEIDGAVLYADLADSTVMVDKYVREFAARVYKTFLYCAAKIIKEEGGAITAYDGDRIMGIFVGTDKESYAVRCALKIRWAVLNIIQPTIKSKYPNDEFVLKHVTGIDTSSLFVAKTGVRGANDLVWVGRAANYAAKLSALTPSLTWITSDVYRALADWAKNNGQPVQNMWSSHTWSFNDSTVYSSNWNWAIG